MRKIVVSVGMGPGQLAFIKRLKELGYAVAAFGKGKNSDEAERLADYTAEIDTRNAQEAIKWINSLNVEVIAVGSFAGGMAVTTVQKLSNYYHVPTEIPDIFVVGADKVKQQMLYEKYGLSSIKTWKIGDISSTLLEKFEDDEEFILKPAVGRGSEGITIFTKDEFINYIQKQEGINSEDIVQIVRKGNEYRCIMIVQNGKLKLVAPILRKSYRDTVFLGVLRYSNVHLELLEQFVDKFIKESNIVNTIIKADIIVSKKHIDIIEMDIGVGGGSYYKKFVSRLYGRNLMDEYIKLITNQPIETFVVAEPNLKMDYVFNHFSTPIRYDLEECLNKLESNFGECEIQINQLHPEVKGGFNSNADFIFTVMHQEDKDKEDFAVDDFVNKHIFLPNDKGVQ